MQNAFELQARSTMTIHVNDRYQYSIHHPPPTTHPPSTVHHPFWPHKAPAIAATTSKAKFGQSEETPAHTLPSLPHQIALEKILVKILKNLLIGIGYEDVKNMWFNLKYVLISFIITKRFVYEFHNSKIVRYTNHSDCCNLQVQLSPFRLLRQFLCAYI